MDQPFKFLFLFSFMLSLTMIGCTEKKQSKNEYATLPPLEFQQEMRTQPGILIDVRTPAETKEGFIANARFMDISDPNFEQEIDNLHKDSVYYVYCAAGIRGGKAAEMMLRKSFKHVVNLEGGIKAWEKASLPIQKQ